MGNKYSESSDYSTESSISDLTSSNDYCENSSEDSEMTNMMERIQILENEVFDINYELDRVSKKIKNVYKFCKPNPNENYTFYLIKVSEVEYHVLNMISKNVDKYLSDKSSKYPEMEILLKLSYSITTTNLWSCVKKYLKPKMILSGNMLQLVENYEEEAFIEDIMLIYDDRFIRK